MKLNWNFLGGEGVQNKKPSVGEYGYFLELHYNYHLVDEENVQEPRVLFFSLNLNHDFKKLMTSFQKKKTY